MSDEGTARPFSPAELDAIEDALEQLQGEDAFAVRGLPDGGDALVRERLASYRSISRLSRDVLHRYAAPSHVLERVRAIARESAGEAPSVAPRAADAQPSWWARVRRSWTIPMVATAAAIALVVVITVPMSERNADREGSIASPTPAAPVSSSAASKAAETAAPAPADSRLAMADDRPADADEGEAIGVLRGAAALEEASTRDQQEKDGTTVDRLRNERRADSEAKPAKPAPKATPSAAPANAPKDPIARGGGGAPGSPPAQTPTTDAKPKPDATKSKKGADKSEPETLTRADTARRAGDCAAAVPLYEQVRTSGTRKQRARALAGLALCAESSGEAARASDLLAKARVEDAEIDAYVETER